MAEDDEIAKNVLYLATLRAENPFREKKPDTSAAQPKHGDVHSKQDVVDWINTWCWKITLPGKVRYMSKRVPGKIIFLDRKGLIEDLENFTLTIISAETEKTTFMPWSKIWLESQSRNELDDVIFHPDPKYVAQVRIYNLWEDGWRIKAKEGDVAPFLGLMKEVICSFDERSFKFLAALIAQMIQFPHLKPGVAVVIRGDEGVGKSFFVEKLGTLVAPYYFKTSNPDHIFGDHNSQLKNVILLHLEEAVWPGGKKTESLLKDLIDGKTIPINEKFQPLITVDNHMHLFVTGNPEWLVHAGPEARRIFALHASSDKRNNTKYFGELDKWFKANGAEALMYYFQKFDIQAALDELGIDSLRNVPVTKELIIQKKRSMSEVREWANNWLELGQWPYGRIGYSGHCYVIKSMLYRDYVKSQRGRRNGNVLTERQFGIQFTELFPDYDAHGKKQTATNGRFKHVIGVKGKEIGLGNKQYDAYDIPPVAELRAIWDINLGGNTDWDEKAEWSIKYGDNRINITDIDEEF